MTEHASECLEKLLDLSMAFGVKRPLSLQNVLRVQHTILQVYGIPHIDIVFDSIPQGWTHLAQAQKN